MRNNRIGRLRFPKCEKQQETKYVKFILYNIVLVLLLCYGSSRDG